MPSAAGAQPRPRPENNDACWRAKPRANRRHCFPLRASKGLSLCRRRHSSFFLLLNVYATVACRRRLQKAPRRIHERLPRTHFATGARPWTKTPSSSGTCSKPARQSPRPGLAESGCAQEKAELYLLEKAGRCLWRPGLSPRPRPENNDACWRAKPRANRRHCFPLRGFQRAQPLCRRRHSSSLLLNVYATVACRRRLQKAPRRIHERLPEPIRDRRKALDKDPKLVWDMLEAGNAKARARASRNLDALKKKLNFIF